MRKIALFGLAFATAAPLQAQTVADTTANGLHYEVSGTGAPIVLIHAFSLDRRMWEPQLEALETRYRVIRVDMRGHGLSVPPGSPYTSAGDLLQLLDELGVERAAVVGLSSGAANAIDFAILHPDRVGRIVLTSPGVGGYRAPPLPWMTPVFEAAGAGDPERAARLWAETPIMRLHRNVDAAPVLAALVNDNARLWTSRPSEQPLQPPAIERLSEIRTPALIVLGTNDLPHIHDVGRILDEGIPNARILHIEGAGHIVNIDAPDEFNAALLAFLAGN